MNGRSVCAVFSLLILLGGALPAAVAQEPITPASSPVEDAAIDSAIVPDGPIGGGHGLRPWLTINDQGTNILPDLRGNTLTWVAIVVILALTIQTRPFLSWRTADGFVLALTCLMLALRHNVHMLSFDPTHISIQYHAYCVLAVIALYWLARGMRVLLDPLVPGREPNAAPGAMTVFMIAAVLLGAQTVLTSPLSDASGDGLTGGTIMAETGDLPYGDMVEQSPRSPLLYAAHAGALKVVSPEPYLPPQSDMDVWVSRQLPDTTFGAARLVNLVLFGLTLLALQVIGTRLHSRGIGHLLVTIFCLFPGALEGLARPDVMLPAALVAWSLALSLLAGAGPLLGSFVAVFAGLAWGWAWLLLPVIVVYHWRRGWHAVGATLGALAGIAAVVAGLTWLTAPTLPRATGSLAAAGVQAGYQARVSDSGALVVETQREALPVRDDFKSWFWRMLLEAESKGLTLNGDVSMPPGVDASTVPYRDLAASGEARQRLNAGYRAAVARRPYPQRALAAIRTVLEGTWLPEALSDAPVESTWDLWLGNSGVEADWQTVIRRGTKVATGVLTLLVLFILIRKRSPQPHHLVGGLAAVSAAILMASRLGAVTNLAFLMPSVLAILATRCEAPRSVPSTRYAPPGQPVRPTYESRLTQAPPPRITIED